MDISGHTEKYAVLGHPIGHTLSPVMHNAAFEFLDRDAVYLALDVAPERLMPTLQMLRELQFRGLNLTIPLKETAFHALTDLDASARLMRAVNTIDFNSDTMRGYNTDADGFRRAVEAAFDFDFEGKCIFVLGTGGAGRTTALTAAQAGAAHITLTDLDIRRAQQLREEITRAFPNTQTDVIEGAQATPHAARADLIVQATPIGMEKGDPSLLEPEAFHERQCVFDLIYMYPETPLMQAAGEAGAQTANGLGMLLHQGALALSIWTGREPPLDVMRRVLEERVYC